MSKKPSLRQLQRAHLAQGLSTSVRLPATDLWQAWFDGAASPNPGRIGLGIVLASPSGERFEHALKTSHHGCSNEAELRALIAALELAGAAKCRRLIVYGDSRVAIDHVSGAAQTNIPRLRALIAEAHPMLAGFNDLQLLWIPRHRNADADRLSRTALGLAPKPL